MQQFHTIIFLGFNETYDNLSYKTLSIMYWVNHRINNGRFKPKWIFKVDDDNLVDIYNLENYLKSLENNHNDIILENPKRIYCYVRDDATPIRHSGPENLKILQKNFEVKLINFREISWKIFFFNHEID